MIKINREGAWHRFSGGWASRFTACITSTWIVRGYFLFRPKVGFWAFASLRWDYLKDPIFIEDG
jgi:hypothetical protein